MYEATITLPEAHAPIAQSWAKVLGWTFNRGTYSPYDGDYSERFVSITLTGDGAERVLEDALHAAASIEEEGAQVLRIQVIIVVYDTKTGEDWITDSDESERAAETAAEGINDGE